MGKPDGSNVPSFLTESIGRKSETWGSETSQYPQEKKSTEIAQVVASERAAGQTVRFTGRGCGTQPWQDQSIAEGTGKFRHRG